MKEAVTYPQTKFLTQDGVPLHPITDTEGYLPGDKKIMVRMCFHQSSFSSLAVPDIGDDVRYMWVSIPKWKYDLMPEGTYSVVGRDIVDITAPSVDAGLFQPFTTTDQYEQPPSLDPVLEALTDVRLQAERLLASAVEDTQGVRFSKKVFGKLAYTLRCYKELVEHGSEQE